MITFFVAFGSEELSFGSEGLEVDCLERTGALSLIYAKTITKQG